ncbi:MAG: histidine--tRNA ligase [Alphaproteobacteria bacterium]
MSDKKKIYKPKPISGYPEYLPAVRRVEQRWLDHIRRVFESYGFCNIETPAVEALDVIAAKGEDVDKEIYVLERLQADPEEKKEARLALHFDQTVPLARYVGQHFNGLTFPFKRYQMQKVWRGERPQAGRFREFTQCDIDVINVDALPLSFDAEMPAIVHEVLQGLDIPDFEIRISNRKILIGFLKSLNITDQEEITLVTRCLDKLEKVGETEFLRPVIETIKDQKKVDLIVSCMGEYITIARELMKVAASDRKKALGLLPSYLQEQYPSCDIDQRLNEGIEELSFVMDQLSHLPNVVADLSIVRGLDYYTGTVYETVFVDDPSYGSICSGGRYDDLASSYINKKLPGVGISIGFSRLFAKMIPSFEASKDFGRTSPADVLVILNSEEDRALSAETAKVLRGRGMNVELYHAPQKFQKQISYAEKKGIPFIWMPPYRDTQHHEVKCLTSGAQMEADPNEWKPTK